MKNLKRISEEEALQKLRDRISYDVNQNALAKKFEVSAAFMSMVLRGEKRPTEVMLESIGVKRVTEHVVEFYENKGGGIDD